ncbi:c-type cytochrome [Campylobacter helveticus]|uniref:Cytochrome c n=1 Tax=Campylobacter helveticus TaxID=28898 RepID=A0AAX2UGF0_9BACT|nr:cytochrome c [Campylobacter helveticus]ARE81019.1 cytochrome c553 [Campylobacter helveticus]MCR2054007.1 cytochrome c [Campylobacter helveticus]TNB54817.1 cytochrome c [Campylobacter helveticus]TNB60165.1 cytochrome c [Campylobacter helveticus]TNB62322.1 cytochrome c [Campylobacter helveticus]
MAKFVFLISIFIVGLFGVNLKSFFTYTFDAGKTYDMQKARDLYFQKKCQTCHGDNGERKISGKALKDMKPEDIKYSLINFTLEGGNSVNMAVHSRNLSHAEIDEIIAYIKGEDFAVELQVKDLLEEEPPQKTKHGIFIK